MPNPNKPPPTDPDRVWQRARTLAASLAETLDALAKLGGVGPVAAPWTPKARCKALREMQALRASLEAPIRVLEPLASPPPTRSPRRPPGPLRAALRRRPN